MKNKKALIGVAIVVVIVIIIGVIIFNNVTKEQNEVEQDVITVIENLNTGTGNYGDWSSDLEIIEVVEVRKIDLSLMDEGTEIIEEYGEDVGVYMMNLQVKGYGETQIIVVNGMVTANSIFGETYEDMWESNIFTDDEIDVDKINEIL